MEIQAMEKAIRARLLEHEGCFEGLKKTLLKISACYPGLWMEHIYDSVFYAKLDQSKLFLAENAINSFIDFQREDGQLPFALWASSNSQKNAGYSQIQECVSFGSLALAVYEMNQDRIFLQRSYNAVLKWVDWLKRNRMTRKNGLVEMFFGFDTGHDNSARVLDLGCPGNYHINGVAANAATQPPEDNITPVIALDMNCNFYGNLKALEKMAMLLKLDGTIFADEAAEVKRKIFDICFDAEDCFFYDVDKHGNKRKIKSCQIFSLFAEGVLDPKQDADMIQKLCNQYLFHEKHFFTPYPFPAVSISDPTWKKHTPQNCWGYFTQSLTVLRCTLWMEKYGFVKEFNTVCDRFAEAWTRCFDTVKLGQELDPITGIPSNCSEWYSSAMLMYLYCVRRNKQ